MRETGLQRLEGLQLGRRRAPGPPLMLGNRDRQSDPPGLSRDAPAALTWAQPSSL